MSTRSAIRSFAAFIATLSVGSVMAATPCTAPASYVKSPEAARAPLLRPFVLNGVASTALHLRGDQRWLELAVPDTATAQRLLAGRADAQQFTQAGGVVLLACRGLDSDDARVAQQGAPLAAPLW